MAAAPSILVVNGPNLNMLGTREPAVYGRATLADLDTACRAHAERRGVVVTCRQSNHEGELVDWIQAARGAHSGIIVNAGAFTHTSVALRDALLAVELPVVEVHMSNLFRREPVRHHSYISDIAVGVICGFGVSGYRFAIDALADRLLSEEET